MAQLAVDFPATQKPNGQSMLRRFQVEDVETLKHLIDTTIDASYGDVYPPEAIEFFKQHHSRRQIRSDAANGYTIVLQAGDRIVGTGTLLGSEIRRMFVAPDVQKRGLGRRLLAALEQKARESGLHEVELHASLVARPFYERMGFRVVKEGCVPLENGQRIDCFVMTKELRGRPSCCH